MHKMKIEYLRTADLVPFAQNARTHSERQVVQIGASIKEFGFNNPVLIDEANGIIAGHGRVLAAEDIGMDEVPCIRLSHLSERQRRAYVLADNKLALASGWDFEKLAEELSYLVESDFSLDLTGFDEQEIDALLKVDRSILPPEFTEPETIVQEHKRKAKADKPKPETKRWAVRVEAGNKSMARDIFRDMTDKGFKCLIVENGDD